MKNLTVIMLITMLSACSATDTRVSEYHNNAPAIMAFAADQTGMQEAPIPTPTFVDGMDYGAAFYRFETKTIILPSEWEPDPEGLSSLAHEFTHAIQWQAHPEVYERQKEQIEIMERSPSRTDEFTLSIVETCLEWETEAYTVGYLYKEILDPKAVRTEILTLTIPEAAETVAKGSCKEVIAWHNKWNPDNPLPH